MSDDDRLADYLRRIEGDNTPRDLPDGCNQCGLSLVSCHSRRYLGSMSVGCCRICSHERSDVHNEGAK